MIKNSILLRAVVSTVSCDGCDDELLIVHLCQGCGLFVRPIEWFDLINVEDLDCATVGVPKRDVILVLGYDGPL